MTAKNVIIIALMLSVLAASGCVYRNQYYLTAGIVTHSDSLEEAFDKCADVCDRMMLDYCIELYDEDESSEDVQSCYERRRDDPTPKLSECSEKECQCEC